MEQKQNKQLRLKILKKLRTASLNSKFTGLYKKNLYKCFESLWKI